MLHDSSTDGSGYGRTVSLVEEFFDELVETHAFFARDDDTDTQVYGAFSAGLRFSIDPARAGTQLSPTAVARRR